jgi:hypothetical protein
MKYDREMGKMSDIIFITVFLAIASGAASGAEVRGVVRDTSTGELLANVAIQVAGLAKGTISDATGRFYLIDIPAGHHSLCVRFEAQDKSISTTQPRTFPRLSKPTREPDSSPALSYSSRGHSGTIAYSLMQAAGGITVRWMV